MRKYLYLITEHEDSDKVGMVEECDGQKPTPTKNEEGPIRVFDEKSAKFRIIGKEVALGYYDFESETEYNNNEKVADVMQSKVREVDREWAQKAGIGDVVYGNEEATA